MATPISTTDRFYRAEVVPSSIDRLGVQLCQAYGRPAAAFGDKGNQVHDSGYHRSRAWVLHSPDSRYGVRDYSVLQPLDRGGDENWVAAFDFTPGDWGTARNRALMAQMTGRVYAAAKAHDPRLSTLREFAGTLDGRTVVTFNCADGSLKTPFDPTHLDHGHGSAWRSRAADDHSGVLAVILGQGPAGEDPEMYIATDGTNHYWFNGVESRRIPPDQVKDAIYLARQIEAKGSGPEWTSDGYVRTGWSATIFGPVRDSDTGGLTDGDRALLAGARDAVTALNSRLATP